MVLRKGPDGLRYAGHGWALPRWPVLRGQQASKLEVVGGPICSELLVRAMGSDTSQWHVGVWPSGRAADAQS
jgi:hypothetical protein